MSTESSSKTLIRGASIVSSLTILSRILGLIRDLIFASLFGASFIADAFFVAFRIPNILRSFVAEGALTSAFVPVFASEIEKDREGAQNTLTTVTSLLLLTTLSLALLGVIFSEELVSLFAPGFYADRQRADLCATLLRIMMPYVVFVSLVAMLNGALNTVKIFGAAAFAQVAMNLTLIIGGIIAYTFPDDSRAHLIATAVIVGGMAQIIVQLPALKKAGFVLRVSTKLITPASKEILRLIAPALIGAAVYQITMIINTVLASLLRTGSVSWLFYADRLAQLPIGIFSIALASVLLPTLSNAAAQENSEDFARNYINSLRYTSFIIIPTAFGLFLLAHPLITLIFQRGAFSADSTLNTSLALQMLALGIWGISCHSMSVRTLIAKKDTVTPTIIGAISLLIGLISALILMGPPVEISSITSTGVRQAQNMLGTVIPLQNLGHAGLALSSTLASCVSFLLLTVIISRRIKGIDWKLFITATIKALLAGAFMAGGLVVFIELTDSALAQLLLGIPLGIVLYGLFSFLLKNNEMQETFQLLTRLISRR